MSTANSPENNEVVGAMSIRDAIEQVGEVALERHRKNARLWEHFYDVCTVAHVQHYLRDYLDQFGLDGAQTRRTYDLDVSICLAKGLQRAREREQSGPQVGAISEQLDSYNDAVRSHILQPNPAALAIARLNLASAMLLAD